MGNEPCVFCNMISGIIPVKKIQETNDLIVICDINPQATIHYLIIPKKHISNVGDCSPSDFEMLSSIFMISQKLSKSLVGSQDFKLISNNGKSVGQTVFHMHVHFLAGKIFNN